MLSSRSCGLLALLLASHVHSIATYIPASLYLADWIQVDQVVRKEWSANTTAAQQEIVAATKWLNPQGPWSVLNKTLVPASGDIHDYYSLSPYWWPDCSNVHNTTALTEQEISQQCNYVVKDGQFNPDRSMVNDTGAFATLSTTVFFNVLAWRITGEDQYAEAAAGFIDTWFLNNATAMNPNLQYSQVIRGANGSKTGTHTGILDMHCVTKIASAIVVMRNAKAAAWTAERDAAMIAWSQKYIGWLTTSPISLEEKTAANNHGTFWFAQMASFYIIVNDLANAKATVQEYFSGIYQKQIVKNGDQPYEASRTLPYHYRSYNAGGTVVLCRIADFLGVDGWGVTTAAGTTIQNAINFVMALPLTDQNTDIAEIFPSVAAVASHYGDPNGQYAAWLAKQDPVYPGEAWYFWDQPLHNSSINVTVSDAGDLAVTNSSTLAKGGSGSSGSGSSNSGSLLNAQLPSIEMATTTVGVLVAGLFLAA